MKIKKLIESIKKSKPLTGKSLKVLNNTFKRLLKNKPTKL